MSLGASHHAIKRYRQRVCPGASIGEILARCRTGVVLERRLIDRYIGALQMSPRRQRQKHRKREQRRLYLYDGTTVYFVSGETIVTVLRPAGERGEELLADVLLRAVGFPLAWL